MDGVVQLRGDCVAAEPRGSTPLGAPPYDLGVMGLGSGRHNKRVVVAALIVLSLAACGPGLDEGALDADAALQPDASPPKPDVNTPPLDTSKPPKKDTKAWPDTGWACREFFATTYDHVGQGRAYICLGNACAYGSNDNLGLYNTVNKIFLRETSKGYFEKGRCP